MMQHSLRTLKLRLLKTYKSFKATPNKLFFLLRHRMVANVFAFALVLLLEAILVWQNPGSFNLKEAAEFVTILGSALLAGLLFFESTIREQIVKKVSSRPHTIILSLSPATAMLIHRANLDNDRDYLIVDENIDTTLMDQYIEKGMGFTKAPPEALHTLKQLNLECAKQVVISTGSETLNLEIAAKLIDLFEKQASDHAKLKLIIETEERSFDNLLFERLEGRVLASHNKDIPYRIELQTFSFYELCAKQLFQQHDVDARDTSIIPTNNPFEIAVYGSGRLFEAVIYQIGLRAHLPNNNPVKVHLLHAQAEQAYQRLKRQFPGLDHVMQVEIHSYSSKEAAFYTLQLWQHDALTRIILCEDDDVVNIEAAGQLYDKIYRRKMAHHETMPDIFFAAYDAKVLSRHINNDEHHLKYFYPFGERSEICMPSVLLEDSWNTIAHIIHSVYSEKYDPLLLPARSSEDWQKVQEKWLEAKVSDRNSSKAQAYHISVKLKALGLSMQPADDAPSKLLKHNQQQLNEVLAEDRQAVGLDDIALQEYSEELAKCYSGKPFQVKYFPKEPRNLFEKLIYCEHTRWNAFHWMNGWHYAPQKNKEAKEHDCLKPLNEFDKPEQQITIIYDIYAILYIPNYLACAGFKLIRTSSNA